MKETVYELLTDLKLYFLGNGAPAKYTMEEPLRAELFSSGQMQHYSSGLAKLHKVSKKPLPDRLLIRLADNEKVLLEVRNLLTEAIKDNYLITPAGEWLLDNFYLIEEQVRTAKKHLPKVYSEGLPQLISGPSAGLPRVYDIALEIISHSDGRIDLESLNNFLEAYQSVTPFQLGELWGVPIMLRLALIENLRRVSARIAIDRINRNLADHWAKLFIHTTENDAKNLVLVIADMARSNPPLERAFVAELTRQLSGKGPTLAQPLYWIEERLIENGQTSNELVQDENQNQAADQVSVSNSIGSLRTLGSMDWREFVEHNSFVEHTLRQDKIYSLMDFSTRDHYRHVVERIAKKSTFSEAEVAQVAIRLSQENAKNNGAEDRKSHVGYFLIGDGMEQTEQGAKMPLSVFNKMRRKLKGFPLTIYLGSIFLITMALSALIVYKVYADTEQLWLIIFVGALSLICTGQLAVTLVNFLCTLTVYPKLLPRMDFAYGIPNDAHTLVAIPSMLTNSKDIEDLVEALEVRYLANKDENLQFGLLTDFTDAKEKELPSDNALVELAQQKIEELNSKYGREKNDLFYLFHRPRKWNAGEKIWMGYERKRGKLAELNQLLRGNVRDNFSVIVGELDLLQSVKYIITLDSDTQLPRDSAWKIIGTMAHPLNRAIYNEKKQRVTEGYGILQPRVSVSMTDTDTSLYARINGNEPGLDPYTRATSDVYQDLFNEGSFIGKGIYDLDIFEKALKDKFPENRILSHDLLEGCYARCGLLSDVQLYEKYPTRYDTDMMRRHRWIRGDLQIAAWYTPFVPDKNRHWRANPLSSLSRWKIFDNIRRSLVPIAFTLFVIVAWLFLPAAAIWTLIVTAIVILPVIISAIWDLVRKPKDLILSHHLIVSSRSAGSAAIRTLFTMICLPYEAYISLQVIVQTSWRMMITHRKLLEWVPSAKAERSKQKTLFNSYLSMWVEALLGICIAVYLMRTSPVTLDIAGPILFLWIIAPYITWWVSKPLARQVAELSAEGKIFLQKLARKTWTFFEVFVTPAENWLPPDNFQEVPTAVIAHRTSPTNIGLSLLSNLTAYDFGYITPGEFIERSTGTIATLQKMERYSGHFYNWYDTLSLKPLWPRYISTVDSGNFAGHMLTLRQGIIALPDQKVADVKLLNGITDTFRVLADTVEQKDLANLRPFKAALEKLASFQPKNLSDVKHSLTELLNSFAPVTKNITTNTESETYRWCEILTKQIEKHIDELNTVAPWILLTNPPIKFNNLYAFNHIPSLNELAGIDVLLVSEINSLENTANTIEENNWLNAFKTSLTEASKRANEKIVALELLATQCTELANMEYDFLYDKAKHLLTIGYNVEEHRSDPSFYDLLASEARLSTFVGIAQGKLPQESWFALSRLLTNAGGRPILLSWSGSMFEYLMPILVMPSYENTLLSQTDKAAVQRQIEYGQQRGVPWGISESCYNMVDAALNYQYRAFGVPGLGLKRGLGDDLVIAPYATAMALMVEPEKAFENLKTMAAEGFEGKYGFYEAVDYTPSRLQRGQTNVVIQSYMAHHHGMSFLSMAYLLLNKPMQQRFEAEPQFQATLLLLQERIPKATSFFAHTTDLIENITTPSEPEIRIINTPDTAMPGIQLLSNGKYHVMLTNAGGGYSRWKDLAVTRWREDGTRDNWGTFCYIRDVDTGAFWSTSYQPTLQKLKNYEAAFSQGRADFRGSYNKIETHTEIVVSPEDDIEMRRIHITNRSGRTKTIDVTSYAEVVIAPAAADAMHPAFGNLFVQTEIIPGKNAIFCTRRPRSVDEKQPWMLHLMKVHGKNADEVSYETDRLAFIGRGKTLANPDAMKKAGPLSGGQGSVLDPIVAVRHRITLEPDEKVEIDMITGIGETREICQNLADKYQDKHHKDRVFELAWTHNQVVLRQINATEGDAQLYSRLANSVIFVNPALRAEQAILVKNNRGQSGLWPYSISGDLPIVLLKIEEHTEIELVRQMVQAHTYWRLKGLTVDLVIWNDSHGGYRQVLQNQISDLLADQAKDQPGGIFVRASEQISNEDRILFQTVARAIISSGGGTLLDHVNRKLPPRVAVPLITPVEEYEHSASSVALPKDLIFFNGYGGFSADGREYVISIANGKNTPAPWSNVIANPNFGTVISESGQSYTWSENAHEMRLTPWENDSVCDLGGEAFYLRDEETGEFWSATPLPKSDGSPYITRHGFGYSIFEHEETGIHSEMCVYVDVEASVKFTTIKIKNNSGKARRITATGYTEWVLGDLRSKTAMYVVTELDPESGALLAKNPYNTEFPDRVAFFDAGGGSKTYTGDRNEFLGRNGSLSNPAAMSRTRLSGKIGAGLDPCAAIQVLVELADGQEKEIAFKLGEGKNTGDASATVRRFRGIDIAHEALEKVKNYWKHTTDALHVETPDPSINLLANGWLNYQTLASRLWGRSGYYQSGGGFGFRDQLQDVISLLHHEPQLARKQIILCASRQFKEGDAQHWWHPPIGRGVRTRCSDDFLWLPYVTCRYVARTGDNDVLNQPVSFLEGRLLNPDEESYYDLVSQSEETASVYEHCVRAIRHGLRFGAHGLPLIGTGDWNDGMDRVGKLGKGESVWLAFFLYDILNRFIKVAQLQNDNDFAKQCEAEAKLLRENIEKNAWDGNWYRRAYFDDGTPLGTSTNEECQIDSIAQSWSVLSGAGGAERTAIALASADKRLVRSKDNLIQLLDPPFDKSSLEPGYIKGYVPGVRENGGQYTHAAVWMTMAFAKMGDNKRAWELLNMINPINHGRTAAEIEVYKVEPYVAAGDVYAFSPHVGRGGWTWYTGSAGWMYELITGLLLGVRQDGGDLSFAPCIPAEWETFKLRYRYINTYYQITFNQKQGAGDMVLVLDGNEKPDKMIEMVDDGKEHVVEVRVFAGKS